MLKSVWETCFRSCLVNTFSGAVQQLEKTDGGGETFPRVWTLSLNLTNFLLITTPTVGKLNFVLTVSLNPSADFVSKIWSVSGPRGASAALNRPPVMNIDYENNASWNSLRNPPVIEPRSWISDEDDINYAEWLVTRQRVGLPRRLWINIVRGARNTRERNWIKVRIRGVEVDASVCFML